MEGVLNRQSFRNVKDSSAAMFYAASSDTAVAASSSTAPTMDMISASLFMVVRLLSDRKRLPLEGKLAPKVTDEVDSVTAPDTSSGAARHPGVPEKRSFLGWRFSSRRRLVM